MAHDVLVHVIELISHCFSRAGGSKPNLPYWSLAELNYILMRLVEPALLKVLTLDPTHSMMHGLSSL